MKKVIPDRQDMDGLNITMPGVFVRMHHIKPAPRRPPCGRGKPQLVDPAWLAQGRGNPVVAHARPLVIYFLGKDMDLVTGGKLLDQGNGIALRSAAG